MNTFVSDLIQIAYQQDCIPGYVQDDAVVMLCDAIEDAINAMNEEVDAPLVDQPQPFVVNERDVNSVMRHVFAFWINTIYVPEWVELHPNWGVMVREDRVLVEIPGDKFMEAFAEYQIVVRELERAGVSYSTLFKEEVITEDDLLPLDILDEQIVRDEPQHDRKDQIAHQPIQGPRELGIPMSENLKYIYTWVDGREVRTLRKQYQ